MKHNAVPSFWECFNKLSKETQELARKKFELLKNDPEDPSLKLKMVDGYWSVRVGLHHGALAVEIDGGLVWFLIGTHAEYDHFVR